MSGVPQISVCVPAYDMQGQGGEFLSAAFESLLAQSFTDFEVIVADQSDTDQVARVCVAYARRLNLKRVDNRSGLRQASANTNFAMHHATGRVLKILFQDDFLCHPEALTELAKAFNYTKFSWCVTGSGVTRDGTNVENAIIPEYQNDIRFGLNTISSPSVLALDSQKEMTFDEELIWLMDVDMYHRCHEKFGPPLVLPDTHVANRLHEDQVSAGINAELRRKELAYIRRKHGLGGLSGARTYLWQQLKTRKSQSSAKKTP